jgi:hypothetical protein
LDTIDSCETTFEQGEQTIILSTNAAEKRILAVLVAVKC